MTGPPRPLPLQSANSERKTDMPRQSAAARPGKILLATDLSCRSDRAVERAVRLAGEWGAELVVVHLVSPVAAGGDLRAQDERGLPSWRRGADPAQIALQRLRRDLPPAAQGARILVEKGDPGQDIAAIARREGCGLIVAGVARSTGFERAILGSTVDRLVRTASMPILVARDRAFHAYRDVVVATDFSEGSAHALGTASAWFPAAALKLFHGYETPFAAFTERRDLQDETKRLEAELGRAFLDRSGLAPEARARVDVLIEHGDPVRLLPAYVNDSGADLTVIASHGRSALFDILIGSVARRLLEAVPGDVLLVRDPRSTS